MSPSPEPQVTVRARSVIVVDGLVRYMGEEFQLGLRQALGFIMDNQVEQVIDATRSLGWILNNPGPIEDQYQGSRESAAPGQTPGQQHTRQTTAWLHADTLTAQQPRRS